MNVPQIKSSAKVSAIHVQLFGIDVVRVGCRPAVPFQRAAHQADAGEELGERLPGNGPQRFAASAQDLRHALLDIGSHLALPEANNLPTTLDQRSRGSAIPLHIAADLAEPIAARFSLAELLFE